MFCIHCGAKVPDGEMYCGICGQSVYVRQPQSRQVQPSAQRKTTLPPENQPLNPWEYFGLNVIFAMPLVGFVCAIILSFHTNVNLRNYARSYWCALLISIIFLIIFLATGVATGAFERLMELFQNAPTHYHH